MNGYVYLVSFCICLFCFSCKKINSNQKSNTKKLTKIDWEKFPIYPEVPVVDLQDSLFISSGDSILLSIKKSSINKSFVLYEAKYDEGIDSLLFRNNAVTVSLKLENRQFFKNIFTKDDFIDSIKYETFYNQAILRDIWIDSIISEDKRIRMIATVGIPETGDMEIFYINLNNFSEYEIVEANLD